MIRELSILAVEDDEHLASMLERTLPRWFARAVVVRSAAAGVVALRSLIFDSVLSDYHLPDGTGAEILKLAAEVLPNSRRILWSGEPAGVELGNAHVLLPKPVDLQTLREALSGVMPPDAIKIRKRLDEAVACLDEFKAAADQALSNIATLWKCWQSGDDNAMQEEERTFRDGLRLLSSSLAILAEMPFTQLDPEVKMRLADAQAVLDGSREALQNADDVVFAIRRAWESADGGQIAKARSQATYLREQLKSIGETLIQAANAEMGPLEQTAA